MGVLRGRRNDEVPVRLRIDPVACDGIGMCAHLAPDEIDVDTWGYPVLTGHLLQRAHRRRAAAAVAACPRRALFLDGTPGG